ncbi:protein kinase [Streptomyces sp. NPDC091377]|uniref:serine/threonine-protein kinase n=1 Tax=Streptomyces sp. NPDC091377 TaxID=3365995 RepID=UPI00380B724D
MDQLGVGDPQHIGGYRLLGRLGAGGMGQVYLARSDRGRTVAVKLVREELAAQEEFRARFRQEVQAARRVGGHWTAPVLDADTEAAVPWLATGYVAGPSLQQIVGRDHGALPERSVRILAAGLTHALKDIHAAGMVHRDLKPSNILVTIDGPRVIDFGIARALETVTDGGLTRTGALVGSPGFMAPEQVRGDGITPACDVFCLGSVLAYAATGTLPFGGADSGVHALMFRIAQEEPDLERVPEGIADLVRACLRKDPAARPTLDHILHRTGAENTVADGRALDPWLPGALVAQLGRHAVRLLDAENPENPDKPGDLGKPAHPEGHDHAAGPPHHPPTVVNAPTPHPAYGTPPQPVGWQTPVPGAPYHPYGSTPSYGPTVPPQPPYGDPDGARRRNGRGATAALIAVALVVAVAAGGSVYALMNGGEADPRGGGGESPAPTASAPAGAGEPQAPTTPATPTSPPGTSPGSSAPADGVIPEAFLGTWTTTIDNADGVNDRRLTIEQGEVGDTVLSLVADGPTGGGTYHCVFEADLAERPDPDGPLRIGPSTVTTGRPRSSCSPGEATVVTLLPDGRLRREKTGSGESLTYTKQ